MRTGVVLAQACLFGGSREAAARRGATEARHGLVRGGDARHGRLGREALASKLGRRAECAAPEPVPAAPNWLLSGRMSAERVPEARIAESARFQIMLTVADVKRHNSRARGPNVASPSCVTRKLRSVAE